MHLVISWLVLALAVWFAGAVLPGIKVRGLGGALVVAAVFGVLNWTLGQLLFVFIGVGTLGLGFLLAFLTRWIVDALMLKLTGFVTDKVEVKSFGWALLAALLMSSVGTFGEYLLSEPAAAPAPAAEVRL